MFLIGNDVKDREKQLERMGSIHSCSSFSTTSSVGNPAKPSNAMIKALIRDLSFWDAIPPSSGADTFPSPLPQRPIQPLSSSSRQSSFHQEQPQFMLKRGRNAREYNRQGSRDRLRNSGHGGSRNKGTIEDHSNSAWRPQPVWKAAQDPMTGRTYYYDAVTRRTQWEKPAEVRQMEKQKKAQRRKRDRQFFQEMEVNILKSLRRGEVIPGIPKASLEPTGPPLEPRNANPLGARNFRTLSRMDDTILAELRDDVVSPEEFDRAMQAHQSTRTRPRSSSRGRPPLPGPSRSSRSERSRSRSRSQRQPVDASATDANKTESNEPSRVVRTNSGGPPLPRSGSPRNSVNGKPPQQPKSDENTAGPEGEAGAQLLDGTIKAEIQALSEKSSAVVNKNHVRRNTGGTIYVDGTMSNPDVEATIKCVCGVYRAHLVQASEERNKHSPVSVMNKPLDLEIFHDRYHLPTSWTHNTQTDSLPSLADIVGFYQEFYRRSQMEFDTIIMSLIYVERLTKTTHLTPGPENWRSVLFSCMVLASKVWDDLSMWNIDFSNVASAQSSNQSQGLSLFTLQRVNQLELILLKSLNFDVRVPASEYAKYYFLIRTMLMRSGLLKGTAKPLGKEEAKILENRTSQYQDSKLNKKRDRRVKSMYDYSWLDKSSEENKGDRGLNGNGPVLKDKACLEPIADTSESG